MKKEFTDNMTQDFDEKVNDKQEIKEGEDPVVVLSDDSEVESLEKQLKAETEKAEEYLLTAKRLQAEFDNYRKRTNETNKRVREDGNADVLMGILPVLDAITQAEKMISDEKTLDGIKIITRQLDELLSKFGVKKIEALGKEFDPNLHNAIMQIEVDDEQKKNCVVEVYQEGYMLNNRVLRHSVVIVGK